jgi:hypothetical protein
MARRSPFRKSGISNPSPRLARNTIIGSMFRLRPPLPLHVARGLWPARPRAVIRAGTRRFAPACTRAPGRRGTRDWRAGRDAVYRLAALTIGAGMRSLRHRASICSVPTTSPIRSYRT